VTASASACDRRFEVIPVMRPSPNACDPCRVNRTPILETACWSQASGGPRGVDHHRRSPGPGHDLGSGDLVMGYPPVQTCRESTQHEAAPASRGWRATVAERQRALMISSPPAGSRTAGWCADTVRLSRGTLQHGPANTGRPCRWSR
jgi:hypothetical protein